ncbi:hypothetical protein MPTK1_1g21190 [Marchantia polymorpha subsp. ruderalis]|uniref:Uncharacterized protein n=2 Tax=Marchantia polymorpha TaxID=3197 RepID=A0AAF6ASK2_MARPO|nr:hypothetical protein MARPO_0001s0453 [Marchantia polymorpha]BBM99422.1 hypothetical protein Mp_1g21190 [Marchantia polymorpha subsp. ruderalis]|eukprot:PTQ50503.1 hypothetical protein MARPO_0001s0453 [Marchantia polymorpha]
MLSENRREFNSLSSTKEQDFAGCCCSPTRCAFGSSDFDSMGTSSGTKFMSGICPRIKLLSACSFTSIEESPTRCALGSSDFDSMGTPSGIKFISGWWKLHDQRQDSQQLVAHSVYCHPRTLEAQSRDRLY